MPKTLLTLLALLLTAHAAVAEVTLPSVFGDHMVLQRDQDVRIWGKAEPGELVGVSLGHPAHDDPQGAIPILTDQDGNWQIKLPKQEAGTGLQLRITGDKTAKPLVIKNIAFGEVWVASGQSNMEWKVRQSNNADEEIANSANDQVRMWTARRTVSDTPAFDVPGRWAVASPQTTGEFSAVAYAFARKLQEELGVPVGILHSSWGGTPVEAWTSRGALDNIDWAKPILQRYDAAVKAFPQAKAEYDKALQRWQDTRNGPANTGFDKGYAKPGFDDSQWQTMKLPQAWEKAGLEKDGVVWFRKSIDLPDGWEGQELVLSLGPIDDGDTTYVNGTQVGSIPMSVGGSWQRPRVYPVDKALVKAGKLLIVVRVVDNAGAGGIWGKPEQLTLGRKDGQGEPVSLAGDWAYLHTTDMTAQNRPAPRPSAPFGPEHPHAPAGLFNGMIAPITPYTIRGAIWYQGESNASRAEQYEKLFPGMIADWRKQWGQGDFPFLFVQLANYRQPTDNIVDTAWAHLRDAQLNTLREVENTGMAVTIDIGDANDIHPRNKQDVGKRLARWALADTYGKEDLVKSGPLFPAKAHVVGSNKLRLLFEDYGSGIQVRGEGELQGFSIAGQDGKFVAADALIVHEDNGLFKASYVEVWSDQVKDPQHVRYAWEDNPDEANLVNEEGLPASPFRTDDFKGPTDGRR